MSNMYEGQYIVNSFHAVNADTGEVLTADETGYITVTAGTTIKFESPYGGNADVYTLVFFTKDDPLTVTLNDNEMYPFYVEANVKRGIKNLRVHSFTVQEDATFYYEGIVC